MSGVPLDDQELDEAVFCLSLMGANFSDYLVEAWRVLKVDGFLHIWEASSRFGDVDGFVGGLEGLGFDVVKVEQAGKFTHIRAVRTTQCSSKDGALRF